MRWEKQVVETRILKLHFSDRLTLPSARTDFGILVRYLGSLGCQMKPEAFFRLCEQGNLNSDVAVVEQRANDGTMIPILVTAAPTQIIKGELVLRIVNLPVISEDRRTKPIPQAIPIPHEWRMTYTSDPMVISRDGISGILIGAELPAKSFLKPFYNISSRFAYCLLACSPHRTDGFAYSGAPYGFRMRLDHLYFFQECALLIIGTTCHPEWCLLF
jgi:hypothetical protein